MRTLFGVVLGVAITFGAAFFHDNNIPPAAPPDQLAERPIVNWDVLGAVLRQTEDSIRHLFGG